MRQLFQNLGTGEVRVESIPSPQVEPGKILIQSECSLISVGTERMLVSFGRSSVYRKIRSQPEKVRQVLAKMRTDGLLPTIHAVRNKLADPIPLGYSQVGRVLAIGPGVQGFKVGDRVVSNGPHAEQVVVSQLLSAVIPDCVPSEDAVYTVVGSIGLQGIRLLNPTLGESIAVLGLGLIGLLAVQILQANGCRVLALDPDATKVALAQSLGATGVVLIGGEDPISAVRAFAGPSGVDGVLITASTPSQEPILQSADMCRQHGRIVLVGVVGLNIPRDAFYKKELSFQVSCSYGPGRYDPTYEEQGHDYPLGYVRWTEQRNFLAFLDLLANNRIKTAPLLSASFSIEDAPRAYQDLLKSKDFIGVILNYPRPELSTRTLVLKKPAIPSTVSTICPGIAIIGAGNYTKATLLPLLDKCSAHRRVILMSRQGASAAIAARRFGFSSASNDLESVLNNPEVSGVIITTRHDTHADLVVKCLDLGKHVFVEKPLATTLKDLSRVKEALARNPSLSLTVGFNRRHAPMSEALARKLRGRKAPLHMTCLINAGALPPDHWAVSQTEGGGRIVGEGCHFIDLMRHWVQCPIVNIQSTYAGDPQGRNIEDMATIALRFADGSTGVLNYLSNGPKSFPKEEFTLMWDGKVARLDNFNKLKFWGCTAPTMRHWMTQQKGHLQTLDRWIKSLHDPDLRDDASILLEVSEWTIKASVVPA
jgi:predicted dehydrogenase/threonine dehydrogenase-like Zn-dependent dehydrogenase